MEVSNLYDNGPISPIAKIKENLSVWSLGRWAHYNILFIEPIPMSSPLIIDMVTVSGATTLAAAGTIQKTLVAALQLNDLEFVQLRFEPLDGVEGVLWEQSSVGKFVTRSVHARVSPYSSARDPYLATTTFYIIGRDRNMNLEVRNISTAYPTPTARFAFFGFRYVLEEIDISQFSAEQRSKLGSGDVSTVRQIIGTTSWVPAEGRSA